MKNTEATPELLEKKQVADSVKTGHLKREGLEYLFKMKTLDFDQYSAGRRFQIAWELRNTQITPKSCLSNLTKSEGGCGDPSSEYWQKMLKVFSGGNLYTSIYATLCAKLLHSYVFKETRKTPLEIIERIAGRGYTEESDGGYSVVRYWNVEKCAAFYGVGKTEASEYISDTFDILIAAIDELEKKADQ